MGDELVSFKSKRSVDDMRGWLEEFQRKLDEAAGNHGLQFISEIYTIDKNLPQSQNKDKVQIIATGE